MNRHDEVLEIEAADTEDIMTSEVTLNLTPATKPRFSVKSITRYVPAGVRIVLGLLFFVCGLDGFLHVLPQPAAVLPEGALSFVGALMNSGYMFPLIFATQVIVGALLLANRYVPLALVLLAPFMVNSIAFHIFLEPSGRPMATLVLLAQLYLAWKYRDAYRGVLSSRAVAR